MSRIRPLDLTSASDAQLRVRRAIIEGPRSQGPRDFALTNPDGSLAGPFDALARAGDLGLAVQRVGEAIRFKGKLDPQAREIAILVVAQTWACVFEWHAHEAVARRLGIDDATLDALASGRKPDDLTPHLSAVHDVVAELARTTQLSDKTFAASRPHLDDDALIELLILVGYYTLLAGLLNGLHVGLPDPNARSPLAR